MLKLKTSEVALSLFGCSPEGVVDDALKRTNPPRFEGNTPDEKVGT